VHNFGDSYYGSSNLVEATLHSDNSIYAQLVMDVGVQNVVNVAKTMGIMSPVNANPPIVLGGLTYGVSALDMASAYGTLATGGVHVPPTIITKVWDANGKLIWQYQPKPVQAVPANVAATATEILELNVQRGTGTRAQIDRPAAGKTGTATDFSDAWFCGFTPHLATAVWMGHPEGRVPMTNVHGISVTGGSYPAMIWHDFMYQADRTYPEGNFPGPGDELKLFGGSGNETLTGSTASTDTTTSGNTTTTQKKTPTTKKHTTTTRKPKTTTTTPATTDTTATATTARRTTTTATTSPDPAGHTTSSG